MNVLTLVGAISGKVSHNLSSCNPPRANDKNTYPTTFDDLVGWATQTQSSLYQVACNSDFLTLAAHLVPSPSETWFRGMSVGGSFRRV